jgi:predicted RNase H-like HicB family nuclease
MINISAENVQDARQQLGVFDPPITIRWDRSTDVLKHPYGSGFVIECPDFWQVPKHAASVEEVVQLLTPVLEMHRARVIYNQVTRL